MNSLKQNLMNCYLDKWGRFKKEMKKHDEFQKFHHPHLLSLNDEFEMEWCESDLKIMIFGISTNGWGEQDNIYGLKNEQAINQLMNQYEDFYFNNGNWLYGQVFWNYFYSIHELLKQRLDKKVSIMWNNLYKVHPEMREVEDEFFNLTLNEIKILQPDVIMLLGLGERENFHSRLSAAPVNFDEYEIWHEEEDKKKNAFLYYSIDEKMYDEIKQHVKKIIITYHPNARGNGGIKMKLMLEKLVPELDLAKTTV